MTELFKLRNEIKHYDWGSPDTIPRFMGFTHDGSPCAEVWMGSHSGAPSRAILPGGDVSLGELISGDPGRYLGAKNAEQYGGLPFLFKLLAAEKPLSIQAHPTLDQAREGFERENRAGVARDAPHRNYRDANHKPEIICALTPFTGMCGFRTPDTIRALTAAFLEQGAVALRAVRESFVPLIQALEAPDPADALRRFLGALFNFSLAAREALTGYILSAAAANEEWELMRHFARLYPGDPAVIAPLYLNVFHLEPGEAIFLDAGVLHAYIHGFGVELMASSDNVLRGGLTSKYVDVPELLRSLDFTPLNPARVKPPPDCTRFTYPAPCAEFALTVLRGFGVHGSDRPQTLPADVLNGGPGIGIVTEGELTLAEDMVLKQGESVFIPPAGNGARYPALRGHYTFYIASVPQ